MAKEGIDKVLYLTQAHRQIRRLMVNEENSLREYEDVKSMVELAGSTIVALQMREILEAKKKHIKWLKSSADTLRQAINRMEKEPRQLV